MEMSKQEYWMPFPTPGDLPNPVIELKSLVFSALAGGFFTTVPPGHDLMQIFKNCIHVFMYKIERFFCVVNTFLVSQNQAG